MKPTASAKTRWKLDLLYLESCNCDWGCACIFTFRPTHGNCEGMVGMHIARGTYGSVVLDGLNIVYVEYSPGPLHKGHFKMSFYIDERATDPQFQALSKIIVGEVGGPMAVWRAIGFDEFQPPRRARISITGPKGLRSQVRAEGVGEFVTEPMTDPDGKVFHAFLELPEDDKLFNRSPSRMELASTAKCVVDDGYLKWDYARTFAHMEKTTWKGP